LGSGWLMYLRTASSSVSLSIVASINVPINLIKKLGTNNR
jgi:hypothetical protein